MNYKARRPKPLRSCKLCKPHKFAGNARWAKRHRDRKREPIVVWAEEDFDVSMSDEGTIALTRLH